MLKEQALEILQAKVQCIEKTISPHPCTCECCDCDLNYAQGNIGEQKEALQFAIEYLMR